MCEAQHGRIWRVAVRTWEVGLVRADSVSIEEHGSSMLLGHFKDMKKLENYGKQEKVKK